MLDQTIPPGWPLAEHSRFVETRAHRWHVQRAGKGPGIVLLHGAGAATHSWRGILPLLAATSDVLAMDLPGHGFTRPISRGRNGLPHMAEDVAALIAEEGMQPAILAGHSAGAAIALQMIAAGHVPPCPVIGFNPALMPFQGVAGVVFPPLAKLLSLNPFTAHFFARTASGRQSVRSLIEGTGSRLDADGLAMYQRLISDPVHVDGALRMMASWDLDPLLAALPGLDCAATFAIGLADRAVPPDTVRRQAARMRRAEVLEYPGRGHLMHEEAPEEFAPLILGQMAVRG